MKRITVIALSIVAVSFIVANCGGGLTTSSGKTLVTINGKKVTEGDVDFLGTINPRIKAQLATPAGKKRILDNLVEQELLYQEAVKKGVNRDPEVRAKAELYRRVIVAQSLLDKELAASAKKYYEEHPEEFQKLGMAQILVRYDTPTKGKKKGKNFRSEQAALKLANKIEERLKKGDSFAEVAEEVSDDAATKRRGGDMGLVAKDDVRFTSRGYGPLVDKAFEMKVGEISGPIKTEKGYHIITVTRGVEQEPFEDAERTILFKVRGDVRNDLLARLKKDGSVTYAAELEPKVKAEKKAEAPAATPEVKEATPQVTTPTETRKGTAGKK